MEEIRNYAREKKMPYSKILVEAFDAKKAREETKKIGPVGLVLALGVAGFLIYIFFDAYGVEKDILGAEEDA
jgi:hypothetical protein